MQHLIKRYYILIISIFVYLAHAEESKSIALQDVKENSRRVNAVVATSSKLKTYQSGSKLNQSLLDSNPNGNGDITSILKILPNVQFDNAQLKSTTPGEIDPANISISGGLFYQNNFQLDGFNMNNDLDPAGSQGSNPSSATALPGRSQGLNIDTSLLESIQVQDSNISAAYGGFTGGVVEANTKKPVKKFGANISYQISQGNAANDKFSLTNYHIYESNSQSYENFLNSTSASAQPNFIKHAIRSSIESKFNDNAGIIASFTTMQSFIPLNAYASSQNGTTTDSSIKTQKRQSYNFFIKGYYDIGENVQIESSYAYAPQYNEYFIVNTRDSDFYLQSGGHQLGLKTTYQNKLGALNAQSGFNYMENSRSGSEQHMRGWRYSSDKNWNPNGNQSEGGYGNVKTSQTKLDLRVTQQFEPLSLSFWENVFNVGMDLGYTYALYERAEDTLFSGSAFTKPLKDNEICNETFWCSNGVVDINKISTNQKNTWTNNKGQYMYKATLYKAGNINLSNVNTAMFVEDSMKFDFKSYGDLLVRFGIRLDYDTYMNKAPIAPRLSLAYIAPWNHDLKDFATTFNFGANRYYGRNLFTYALMDGRSSLEYTLERSSHTQSWNDAKKTQNKNDTNFSQLKVPYADELMAGISQQIYIFNLSAKYIHRFGRDEIRRACKDPSGNISTLNCSSNVNKDLRYVYTNDGKSDTDVVSISLQNNKAIDTFGIKHQYLFAFDWTGVHRNYTDYTDILTNGELANQWISYDGVLIRYADRPAENFVRPYTLRLNLTHTYAFSRYKFLWNNFFRYRAGYNTMASVTKETDKDSFVINGVLTKVDTFKAFMIPGAFTWDMRLGVEFNMGKGNIAYVNLDILNVLDSKNIAIASASFSATAGTTAVPVYEVGRQFFIQGGYRF
ncbi:TonB-dependent receptor [Helicobacter trogontum]|uniref:TonB-dependent receptor plug domain-containing protein n=1 Tax=Helicobacter trogontum TaxID=50960 RepID=UPI000CF029C4|nr:TonB-dependent receptor plug domain-containing protein [Helicobacter trogontum]